MDHDKFNPKKLDLDAVVTLAAATFTSKTSSLSAQSLCCVHVNKLGGSLTKSPHVALHECTIAVLDALAYILVNKSSPVVAIDLTMKLLQLVVTLNKEIPSPNIVKHLNTIYSTLKNIFKAKFCTCSDLNPSNAELREELPNPDFFDKNLESHYDILFLQIYKYNKCGIAVIIHYECAMVAYLYEYAAFQAFFYVGVSKLCCKACLY